ncbi:toprim domain-containing protein [Microbispora bryophytorum]|uniref:toprim domain-containing protein n=1 Tax=Microbispora bryophytorum TaxID=1460882 RepID=UPI0033C67DC7
MQSDRPSVRGVVDEVRDPEHPDAAALLDVAAQEASLLRSGQDWARFLDLAAKHRGYGFAALLLIRASRPDATMLTDYDSWRRLGRQVVKGERGIRIVQSNGARPSTVFDIGQTTAIPSADGRVPGAAPLEPAEALASLSDFAGRLGFPVVRSPYDGVALTVLSNEHGRRFIRVADHLDDNTAVAAVAHELAHVMLKHPAEAPAVTSPVCRGIAKLQADSVAYLVLRRLGMDAHIGFPSVSSWAGADPRAPRFGTMLAVGDRVLLTASLVTTHMDSASRTTTDVQQGRTKDVRRAEPEPAQDPETTSSVAQVREVHRQAEQFFVAHLNRGWAVPYLGKRGIDAQTARAWRIGYAPSGRKGLVAYLRSRGYEDAVLEASGLARRRGTRLVDALQDRIVLTLRTPEGGIAGFIGRHSPRGHGPKYLASRGSAKGSVLYGLAENRQALAAGAHPVIVEGPFDAIAVTLAGRGRYVGVATCGTALSPAQVDALDQVCNLGTTGAVITFDGDSAGMRGAVKAFELLRGAEAVRLPEGRDPSAILVQDGPAALHRLLDRSRVPLTDIVVDAELSRFPRLQFAEDRMRALQAVAPIVAALPSGQVARQVVRTATRLGLEATTVNEVVVNAVEQARLRPGLEARNLSPIEVAGLDVRPKTSAPTWRPAVVSPAFSGHRPPYAPYKKT